jgi:hypothetical protein
LLILFSEEILLVLLSIEVLVVCLSSDLGLFHSLVIAWNRNHIVPRVPSLGSCLSFFSLDLRVCDIVHDMLLAEIFRETLFECLLLCEGLIFSDIFDNEFEITVLFLQLFFSFMRLLLLFIISNLKSFHLKFVILKFYFLQVEIFKD